MSDNPLTPEQELIGAILLEPLKSVFAARKVGVRDVSFRDLRNRKIWNAVITLQEQGKPVEIPTIIATMEDCQDAKACYLYLTSLIDRVPSSAYADYYAGEIKRLQRCTEAQEVISAALDELKDGKDTDEKVTTLISRLMECNMRTNIPVHRYGDIRESKIEQWRQAKATGTIGLSFCIPSINQYLGGWRQGCFSVIGAYRATGKSTLCRQDALHHAQAGRGVLLFSLEDPHDIAAATIAGCHSGVSTFHLDQGTAYDGTLDKIDNGWRDTEHIPLWLISSAVGIVDIVAISEMFAMRHKVQIIYIDHIQYLSPQIMQGHNRTTTIAHYSSQLAALAKRLNVPVVVMSQLSRDGEKEGRCKPRLSDLRDSGSLEQDARQVLMLYEDKEKGCFVIDVAKNNYGIAGKEVEVYRLDGKHRFSEIKPEGK